MTITIPSLKDRTLEERLHLIKTFFKAESNRINKEIYVSLNSLRALLSYDCPNNIGQLKSDVQLLCAKSYSEFLTNKKPDVRISSKILPSYIKEGLYKEKEHRVLWNKLIGEEVEYFRFPGYAQNLDDTNYKEDIDSIYNFIEEKLAKLKSREISDIDIEHILEKDILQHFAKNTSNTSIENNRQNLLTIIDSNILSFIDELVEFIVQELNIVFDNNLYAAFALHINTLINRIKSNKVISNSNLGKIKTLYPKEFNVAFKIKNIIEDYIRTPIPIDEI